MRSNYNVIFNERKTHFKFKKNIINWRHRYPITLIGYQEDTPYSLYGRTVVQNGYFKSIITNQINWHLSQFHLINHTVFSLYLKIKRYNLILGGRGQIGRLGPLMGRGQNPHRGLGWQNSPAEIDFRSFQNP